MSDDDQTTETAGRSGAGDPGLLRHSSEPVTPLGYILVGWVVIAVGWLIVVNSDDGGGVTFGGLVGSVGSIFFFIGVIAQGVKVGNRSSTP